MDTALLVDGIRENAIHTQHNLEAYGFNTLVASDCETALKTAAKLQPSVILIDSNDDLSSAFGLLNRVKELSHTKHIPVIVIANDVSNENTIHALDLGAHDYLAKPLIFPIIAAKMRSAMRINSTNRQLELANEELIRLATTDSLTRTYNRRHFMLLAQAEFAKSHRYKRPMAVIMLDVDEFKKVNDQYGHPAGDKALISLADCCLASVRESDIVGRLGGEEFAICCPDADIAGAQIIAERIRQSCESVVLEYDNHQFGITISLGVTYMTSTDTNFDDLIGRADKLLYSAKENGRNCSIAC